MPIMIQYSAHNADSFDIRQHTKQLDTIVWYINSQEIQLLF